MPLATTLGNIQYCWKPGAEFALAIQRPPNGVIGYLAIVYLYILPVFIPGPSVRQFNAQIACHVVYPSRYFQLAAFRHSGQNTDSASLICSVSSAVTP